MKTSHNRIAIVTGAASGIGEAIANVLAEKGVSLALADVNADSLQRVVEQVKAKGVEAVGIVTDIAKREELEKLVEKTLAHFGTVDYLVNNAGIMDNFVSVDELDLALWERVMDINVKGPTILCQLAIRHWLKEKKPGVIVNTASVGGMFGARGGVSYVTSKHAVIGLTQNIAAVYRADNIRCVAVAPGSIQTHIGDTLRNPAQKGLAALTQYVAQGPLGQAVDVAQVVAFLVSDQAKFVNGTVVTVDGGWTGA